MKAFAGLLLSLASAFIYAADPVPLTVKPLDKLWLPQQHNAPAQVLSLNTPDISAEISATVVATPVNVGDMVTKGDVLIRLDCESYLLQQKINTASLERSNAQLSFARSQLVRANNLKKKKNISEELLDQRKMELKVALADKSLQEQNLALSSMNVAHCDVKAPFAAVITQRMVSKGDYANTGQILISLVDLASIEVEADLHHDEIHSLQQAGAVVFEHESVEFAVQQKTMVRVLDPQTQTAKVRLKFKHEIHPWPGTDGRLKWQSRQFLLPAEYISRRAGQLGVFHVVDNKAVFTVLETAVEGRPAAINLPASALIANEGRHRLNDGMSVRIVGDG